jgi:hypothetical protein
LWKPPLRQAAVTLCAIGESAVEKAVLFDIVENTDNAEKLN